ncbi:hypothetical protein OG271_23690 [Micromonospora rifamycinica]|uniref:hypothetical protein n=1 Tax=Micromonospora rifamycinica TaxID=291594 RepID=UPI002E2A8AEB|nr:hypothetical protein [Micromonospora rifamycinica]
MRWLGRVLGGGNRQVQEDPVRQAALSAEVRQRFGTHLAVRPSDQVAAIVGLLDDGDGLAVAATIVGEFATAAHADLLAQTAELYRRTGHRFPVDRRNYRPLWREVGGRLHWPLFALPGGLHPYVHVAAAATVVGARASQLVRATDPDPLLAYLFEVLDLTTCGWEYGRVRVDHDGASLVGRLISTTRDVRAAMKEPPPLPPSVRELMRTNRAVDVFDLTGDRVVGTINVGGELRPALLT